MNKKILVVLILLAIPTFVLAQSALKNQQRRKNAELMNKTVDAMKQIGLAALQYEQDHKGQLPPMKNAASFQKALLPYALTKSVFVSPATGKPFLPNAALAGKKLSSISSQTILCYDQKSIPGPNDPNQLVRVVSVSQFHGTVAMPEKRWQREKVASGIR